MTTGVLLGAGLGAALCLLIYALVPPRPQLAAVVGRWERQRARRAADTAAATGTAGWRDGVGRRMVAELARRGITLGRLRADLALADRTLEAHLVRKTGYALLGLLLPSTFSAVLLAGGITPPLVLPAAGGLVLAVVFFWLPDLPVARRAEQRRHELRRALSCYLDLVAMSLAGGRGIPEALPTAARIGTGWAFELLQDTLEHAKYVGATPWAALAELGERTGMGELVDLGGALLLVADDGAKVRSSLTARASTQRRRQLAEAAGEAEKADQSIQMAQVVLTVGFVLFLGYPAVVNVLAL
jgi:Flp pilus assembly protein TadB